MASNDRSAGMLCPLDQTVLTMSERQGIEIDYCPTCRGVWLDRGELDKMLERSAADSEPVQRPAQPQSGAWQEYSSPRDYRDDRSYRNDGRRKPKRSFLSELFD
ncbi:MAG: zf-TFIIB domain-containing protein [Sphingomicrobium sp.]